MFRCLVKEYYYYGTPALTAFTEAPDPTIISADLWDASNTSAQEWTVHSYDHLGRKSDVTQYHRLSSNEVRNRSVIYGYNSVGQLATETVSVQNGTAPAVTEVTIGRQYFKDGSLKSVDTTRAAQTSGISAYTYDALGRLKTVAGATDVTTYFYDPHGNLARTEQQTTATDKIFADYAYDGMSRLESVVHTKSNNSAEEEISTYDYQLRLDGRRSRAVETREENHSAENTIVITWAYDELGRLVREDRRSQASINSLNDTTETLYFYDLVGNRTKTEQRSDGSLTLLQLFTYDGNDRLKVFSTGDAAAATTQFYHYGDNGQWTVPQEVRGYADVLPAEPSTAPVERTTYTYDGRGRQVTVDDGTHHVQYAYDALGARIGMDVTTSPGAAPAWGVGTTKYVVDHANPTGYSQILEEVNGAGTVTRRYRIGHDVLSQTTSVATQYFEYDGHGSTRTLVTPQGTAVEGPNGTVQEFDYDAYGNLISNISTQNLATTLLYSGEVTDIVTGQQYLRARYYDPTTGRFNSLDPFAGNTSDPKSLHKYAYVHGDPIQGVDPSGREVSAAGAIGASGIGAGLNGLQGNVGSIGIETAYSIVEGNSLKQTTTTLLFGVFGGFALGAIFDIGGAAVRRVADRIANFAEESGATLFRLLRQHDNTFFYGQLDELGRSTGARALLTPDIVRNAGRSPASVEVLGAGGSLSRGHLIGSQLGGLGNTPRNLAPMYQRNVNNSAMLKIENEVKRRVLGGETIDYMVIPIYRDGDAVPLGFSISANGDKGFSLNESILNRPGIGASQRTF